MALPILDPKFFYDHAPSRDFFLKWKELKTWRADFLPIYEWEGVLFIGLVSEHEIEKNPLQPLPFCVYVKTELIHLQSLWKNWEPLLNAPDSLDPVDFLKPPPSSYHKQFDAEDLLVHEPEEATPSLFSPTLKESSLESKFDVDVSDEFAILNAHFRQSMIFLVQGQRAKPWKWTEGFIPRGDISSIDISQPSPFRVVYQTLSSYYGPIKLNGLMNEFAKGWIQGHRPEELSIVPLKKEEDLIGLLLCVGNTQPGSQEALKLLESIGSTISGRMAQ